MTPKDFAQLARLLKERSGLVLGRDKGYLAESGLTPLAREQGFPDVCRLIRALARRQGAGERSELIDRVVEAMTTNESLFFRDQVPFDQFQEVILPDLMAARKRTKSLRVWSAACSSGQEPYSLAMILKEMEAQLKGWRVEIVATDLSRSILARARAGLYTQFEVQRGLPIRLLAKYFSQEGDRWRVKDDLRRMVQFREHNLIEGAGQLGRFDVIFCRNVLIYFDQETKTKVLDELAQVLAEDGYLVLGGAETVLGVSDRLRSIPGYRGLYNRAEAAARAEASGAAR